jgi:hypothetical protein
MRRQHSKRVRTLFTAMSGCALRVLLAMSLWHAPIPWLHAHEVSGKRVAANELLERHVEEFHHGLEQAGVAWLSWHVHFVLPWDIQHNERGAPEPLDQRCQEFVAGMKYGVSCELGKSAPRPPADWAPAAFAQVLARDLPPRGAPFSERRTAAAEAELGSFFASFADSVSIGNLIDRHVC